MTFVEFIHSAHKVGIDHIPKDVAMNLYHLYPEVFAFRYHHYDDVLQAIEGSSKDTINIDFVDGKQHSYLTLCTYAQAFTGLVNSHIDWCELDDARYLREDEDVLDASSIW